MRKKLFATAMFLVVCQTLMAQMDSLHSIRLNEFIFSANKFKENKRYIAQPLLPISQKQIEWAMPQTTANLLEQTGNVFVQKSQAGGGSPVLRGFEASRILMVIDGVRMNNAIYRAGHLQNVITIDNNMLDRVEVLYGPSSTLYGSDALGGVIVFSTKDPVLSRNKKPFFTGSAMTRYSSANNEGTGHIDFNVGFKKIASLTSITYSNFGDVRQGGLRNPFYGNFGLRKEYVESINGVDSIRQNSNEEIQKGSAYSQIDIMEKLLYRQSNRITHTLNLQYSTSSDINRYDRLTDYRNGKLRFAEWYYGPQKRFLAAYQFNAQPIISFFDDIKAGINYQNIEESRQQRDRGKTDLQSRVEKVDVFGYNLDLRRIMNKHELTIGSDGQYNYVNSTATATDINTNVVSPLDTRYPDGGSNMFYTAVYGQHFFKIVKDKLILNDGLRLNYTNLNARFNDKTFFPFPFSEATQSQIAWSGNLGLVYMPYKPWRFVLNGSTGFRAPNVDDIAKVFESSGGGILVVPNPDLKPEYTYNVEANVSYTIENRLKVELGGFYTWFRDAIVLDKFTLNGNDTILYDGALTAIYASQNKAKAYIYGLNGALTANFTTNLTFYSTLNYTYGRYIDLTGKEVPLDHIPPVFGKTSVAYSRKKISGEFYALYNGWKRLKDYSPSGEDNLVYATPLGMPAWYTINVRAGYQIAKRFSFEAALENILDYNYRVFASGISAPGRNLVLTLRGTF